MNNVTTPTLADRAGITYRQLSHWVKAGLVEPTEGPRGSGHYWRFGFHEAEVVLLMADLVAMGVNPRDAEPMARELESTGTTRRGRFAITTAAEATA